MDTIFACGINEGTLNLCSTYKGICTGRNKDKNGTTLSFNIRYDGCDGIAEDVVAYDVIKNGIISGEYKIANLKLTSDGKIIYNGYNPLDDDRYIAYNEAYYEKNFQQLIKIVDDVDNAPKELVNKHFERLFYAFHCGNIWCDGAEPSDYLDYDKLIGVSKEQFERYKVPKYNVLNNFKKIDSEYVHILLYMAYNHYYTDFNDSNYYTDEDRKYYKSMYYKYRGTGISEHLGIYILIKHLIKPSETIKMLRCRMRAMFRIDAKENKDRFKICTDGYLNYYIGQSDYILLGAEHGFLNDILRYAYMNGKNYYKFSKFEVEYKLNS